MRGKLVVHTYDPAPDDSFRSARRWLRSMFTSGEHATCPMCAQRVKRYRYTIDGSMAAGLLAFYLTYGEDEGKWSEVRNLITDPINDLLPGMIPPGTKFSLLRYWGLVEDIDPGKFRSERLELVGERNDGGHLSIYRLTRRGVRWIQGKIDIEKYVYVYNEEKLKRPVGEKGESDTMNFEDAWKKKFRLEELMEVRHQRITQHG